MRLEVVGPIPEPNLPWNTPLSAWPGHLFRTQGCRPGEEWHLQGEHTSRFALELGIGRGRNAFSFLRELAAYGLPVAKPLVLVEERDSGDELLLLELPEQTRPLGEVLMAEGALANTCVNASASLLVLLHLAGVAPSGHERWRFAISAKGPEPSAVLLYGEGELRPELSAKQRTADLAAFKNSLRIAAHEAFFESDQAQAFASRVHQTYGDTWREIENTRLFIEDDIQIKTRVVPLKSLPEAQRKTRPEMLSLNCQLFEGRGMRLLLQLLTGLEAKGERSKHLLQDIFRYHAWLEFSSGRRWPRALAANRWLADCFLPAISQLPHDIGKQMIGRSC